MQTPTLNPVTGNEAAGFSVAYRWYALCLLVIVYVFNFIDRSILGILVQPIKEDLGVSDTLMGFLGGFVFAVFYTFLGIPIARLADNGVRRNVLAICLALWSGATALCGLAQNFIQLALARVGVAVGEAGGSPPAHSMISDMFPPSQRGTALSIYALGIPIGTMLGNLGGGWITEAFDWRTAFMVVGLPGIALAVIVRLTLREPPRGGSEGRTVVDANAPTVKEALRYLASRRSFVLVALGCATHAFVTYGAGYWIAAMFARSHGWSTGEMGTALFLLGFPGILGTFLGGYLADRLGARDMRWYTWLPAAGIVAYIPFSVASYLHSDPVIALWAMVIPNILGGFFLGPSFAVTQGLVGLRMRAMASSVLLFVLNLIGLGFGPQVAGFLSDVLAANTDLGTESLRWSLTLCLTMNLVSAALFFLASRTLRADLDAAQRGT